MTRLKVLGLGRERLNIMIGKPHHPRPIIDGFYFTLTIPLSLAVAVARDRRRWNINILLVKQARHLYHVAIPTDVSLLSLSRRRSRAARVCNV